MRGIALFQLLDLAVGQADAVALLLPVAFVAGDLAQLPFEVDMIRTRLVARRTDDLLRKADLCLLYTSPSPRDS